LALSLASTSTNSCTTDGASGSQKLRERRRSLGDYRPATSASSLQRLQQERCQELQLLGETLLTELLAAKEEPTESELLLNVLLAEPELLLQIESHCAEQSLLALTASLQIESSSAERLLNA
jgi:hypothetical protein